MTIPAALMALLSTESAYGLQLHKEIVSRLPHRAKTNVGQIYSTLERLQRDRLIETAGTTADGLPLYRATPAGMAASEKWLSGETLSGTSDWSDFLDVALLTATLESGGVTRLKKRLAITLTGITDPPIERLAEFRLSQAMTSYLEDVEDALRNNQMIVRAIDQTRPARGRRPKSV